MSFTTYVLEVGLSHWSGINNCSPDLIDSSTDCPPLLLDKPQWHGLPGRGEYIRLVFEYTGTPYDEFKDNPDLMPKITNPARAGIPPNLWPPALELPNGKLLSQTGVIIDYLSPKLGLAGYAKDDANLDEEEKVFLQAKNSQLVFTVLDMAVEVSVGHFRRIREPVAQCCRPTAFTTQSPSTSTTRTRNQKQSGLRSNSEPPAFPSSSNTFNRF